MKGGESIDYIGVKVAIYVRYVELFFWIYKKEPHAQFSGITFSLQHE